MKRAESVVFLMKAQWNGLTPAQANALPMDKIYTLCPKGYSFVVYDIHFYWESFQWARAHADQEMSSCNYTVGIRDTDDKKVALCSIWHLREGKHVYWNGAAQIYPTYRDKVTVRMIEHAHWHYEKGFDVGRRIRGIIDWGGYAGDVVTASKDAKCHVFIHGEIIKSPIPRILRKGAVS